MKKNCRNQQPKMDAASKVVASEPSIGWQSIMARQVILDFADEVYRRFPPGSEVRFRYFRVSPPGATKSDYRTITGIVSKTQHPRENLPDTGLLVTFSEADAADLPAWRKRTLKDETLWLVGFPEIIEMEGSG